MRWCSDIGRASPPRRVYCFEHGQARSNRQEGGIDECIVGLHIDNVCHILHHVTDKFEHLKLVHCALPGLIDFIKKGHALIFQVGRG